MRRNRKIREHRERQLKERSLTVASRRRAAKQRISRAKQEAKLLEDKPKAPPPSTQEIARLRRGRSRKTRIKTGVDYSSSPASKPGIISFLGFNSYVPTFVKPVNVVHVIESIGLGGAQTMAMELFQGLNKYYGEYCHNRFVYLDWKSRTANIPKLFKSYGVSFEQMKRNDLSSWCNKHDIQIVVHHRTSQSECIKNAIGPKPKYVLVNHTWNAMTRMQEFNRCDYYVSVCNFLHKKTNFQTYIHNSRKLVVLNGVENDYLKDLPGADLQGSFKTGRCHRLVPSKFSVDSLRYMSNKILKEIPDYSHHLIGTSTEAKVFSRKNEFVHYYSSIVDRNKKMAIIKALDIYWYETYGHEGASVAVLESLAAGIPVICKSLGGNSELVINKVNGFLAADRSDYLASILDLYRRPEQLKKLKQSTIDDFNSRLHIKHVACKYMQIFENLH